MKKTVIFFGLTLLLCFFTACGNAPNQTIQIQEFASQTDIQELYETTEFIDSNIKTLILDFGFKVTAELIIEEFGDPWNSYKNFKLERNGQPIYLDALWQREYEFCNPLFPIVLQTGANSFELLFEVNNRPFGSYLKRLFVSNDSVIGQDKLPTFVARAVDINNDGIKEFAGYFGIFEFWGELGTFYGGNLDNLFTVYNPILYFSVTETGLKLDSLLTKQRNEMIFGQFHGFSFNADIEPPIPASVIDRVNQEIELLRSKQ